MSKIWFCGMSGPGSLENLKELILPIKDYFNGIVWVLHDSVGSEEEKFLESVKGEGKVIHYYYNKRHNESRNQYLWCGPIKQNDWIVQTDELERLVPEFAATIKKHIFHCECNNVNVLYYYGKPLMFKYHESIRFDGNPHEYLNRQDNQLNGFDLSTFAPDESKVRINVRPIKRTDPFQFIDHYAKYFLFPWGSNHCLLGWESKKREEVGEREVRRLKFLNLMSNRGFSHNLTDLKTFMFQSLTEEVKKLINAEKVWSDFYNYHILGRKDIVHSHKLEDIIPIL